MQRDRGVAPRTAPILILPSEIITIIISLGTSTEITRWREVSRTFKKIVDGAPLIQYLLQLSQLGYIEPIKPRRDLSYSDKTELLRTYQRQLESLGELGPIEIRFHDARGFPTNCKFSRGVFAHTTDQRHMAIVDPMPAAIYVYEITSINKAVSECKVWSLTDFGVVVEEFGMSLSFDLLLLFEIRPPPPTEFSPGSDSLLTIHLRSLRSGVAHPSAAVPFLTFTPTRPYINFDICFRIVGDFVMLLFNMDGPYNKSELVIWDWPSGKKVAWVETGGDSFAFISPNILVIPHFNTNMLAEITNLGQLDVFVLNPRADNNDPLTAIRHVAALQLPSVAPDLFMSLVSVDGSTSPAVHSRTVPPTSPLVPERAYDVSAEDEVLSISISVVRDSLGPIEHSSGMGTLLVHHSDIRDLLKPILGCNNSHVHTIPWSDWADKTVWAGTPYDEVSAAMFYSVGHLMAFVHGRQVLVYDVRPRHSTSRGIVLEQGFYSIEFTETPVPVTMSVELDRMFTTGSNKSRKPKVVASFKMPDSLEDPVIVMDEEHVILVDQTMLGYRDRMYIYSF